MMYRKTILLLTTLAFLAVLGAACSSGGTPSGAAREGTSDGASLAAELANLLSGTYQGEGAADGLRLDVTSVGGQISGPDFNLFISASGTGGRSLSERGVLQLENQGSEVLAAYVPHFDATVTALSPEATQFSAAERNASCIVYMRRSGEGFSGATQGSGTCVRAVAGAVGQWGIEVQPGVVRIAGGQQGAQPLVFRRTSGS